MSDADKAPLTQEEKVQAEANAKIQELQKIREEKRKKAGTQISELLEKYGFDLSVQHAIQHNIMLTPVKEGTTEASKKECADKVQEILKDSGFDLNSNHGVTLVPAQQQQ